jgi:hypothetical protein
VRCDTGNSSELRTISAIEDFQRQGRLRWRARLAIVLGSALDCITSNANDCAVAVSASEWDKMESAPGQFDKITAEAIAEDIERYLFARKDLDPNVKAFFVCLDKYYTEKSQKK